MDLYLVRHGETEWNRETVFRGTVDIPLNDNGVAQARAAARSLSGVPVSAVVSSPLSRARATAEAIARPHKLEVRLDPDLTDLCFGEWQGLGLEEVRRRFPDLYQQWVKRPEAVRFPGGEDLPSVLDRALAAADRVLRERPGEAVVLVSHRVVLKLLVAHALGLGAAGFWRVAVEPASISLLSGSSASDLRLRRLNDTCHLSTLARGGHGRDF